MPVQKKELLALIEEFLSVYPDWRIGQLFANLASNICFDKYDSSGWDLEFLLKVTDRDLIDAMNHIKSFPYNKYYQNVEEAEITDPVVMELLDELKKKAEAYPDIPLFQFVMKVLLAYGCERRLYYVENEDLLRMIQKYPDQAVSK